MVRGLALRQGLLALNATLTLVFALILFLIAREFLRAPVRPGAVSEPDLSRVSAPLLSGPAHKRAEYDQLIARGLFGDAGKYKRGEKPPVAPAPVETAAVAETTLPLTLLGTVLGHGPRDLSAAIIEVHEGGTSTSTFYPGRDVIENVVLQEVHRQEVILLNKRSNRTESLKVSWDSRALPRAPAPALQGRMQPPAATAGARVNLVTLERDKISKQMQDEYARVASTLNVKVVNDEAGKPKGITTDNIENYQVARDLGLKNGDVLVSLNNEPIDSKDRAIEVLDKYKNASMFRVGLLRGGQMQYLTYRVR